MPPISLPYRLFPGAAAAGLLTAALACGDSLSLPAATFTNVVDTVVLAALTATPIAQSSAFDVVVGEPVRTDRTNAFDFAFDIDAGGTPRIYPAGALGLPAEPGVLLTDQAFDALTSAPLEGYVTDSALVVAANTVFVIRSRTSPVQCAFSGGLPRYGKFHVLNVDLGARTVTLEMLVDLNCGYRGLEPGTPEA
jgi:hypothetical protein